MTIFKKVRPHFVQIRRNFVAKFSGSMDVCGEYFGPLATLLLTLIGVQVLLCSDCRVGRAKAGSLEVTTVPEPGSILLEQWTVAILPGWREAGTTIV
jgi:hypothetical protein